MDRIKNIFQNKNSKILSVYFTAGHPRIEYVSEIIKTLSTEGVDLIEIGMPFSDPIADGPTIQESNSIALKNGITISILFKQLKNIRQHTQIPLILMGYLNPVLQFGINKFCKKANECGIDGLIIPDLPIPEYLREYKHILENNSLKIIFLITPQTNTERIKYIDKLSKSFIYMVTSNSVTGKQNGLSKNQINYFNSIKKLKLKNPLLAGFGISKKEDFETVCKYVNGGIIGSSFIKVLNNNSGSLQNRIQQFIKSIIL